MLQKIVTKEFSNVEMVVDGGVITMRKPLIYTLLSLTASFGLGILYPQYSENFIWSTFSIL